MAEYKSRFTGQEIDAGVVRANDAVKQFTNTLITPLVDNVIWKVVYYDANDNYLSNSGWMCRVANQYSTTVSDYQITQGAYARICIANDKTVTAGTYTTEEIFNRLSIIEIV